MSYYKEWEQITSKVFELIKNNSELLQYVCNSTGSPTDTPPPDWNDIMMKNVFPVPKDPLPVDTQKSFLNVYINSSYPYKNNPFFREDYLCIEVACHLEVWPMDNGRIRPYVICNLVDEMLNYKSFEYISIKKVTNESTEMIKYGDMFYGFRIAYKLSSPGASTCG